MPSARFLGTVTGLATLVGAGLFWLATPLHGQHGAGEAGGGAVREVAPQPDPVERTVEMVARRNAEIGVTIKDLPEADLASGRRGVLVEEVREGGPAADAGLRPGDLVVSYDGEPVRSARHFARLVDESPVGRPVKMRVERGGQDLELTVTPRVPRRVIERRGDWRGAWPDPPDALPELEWLPRFEGRWPIGPGDFDLRIMVRPGRLGVGVQDLTPELATYFGVRHGVLVTSVGRDTPGSRAGLRAGDVITAVDGAPVEDSAELRRRLWRDPDATSVALEVVRDRKPLTLTVTFDAGREDGPGRRAVRRRA